MAQEHLTTRNRRLSLARIVFLAACALLAAGAGRAARGEEQLLSVEDTLKDMARDADTADFKRALRSNPAVRPQLYAILRDPKQERAWGSAAWRFAYVGQADDVKELEQYILDKQGNLGAPQESAVGSTLTALAAMTARGVPGAKSLLDAMLTPAYWRKAKFTLQRPSAPGGPSFETEMVALVLQRRAWALEDNFGEIADSALASFDDPAQKALLKTFVEKAKQNHVSVMKSVWGVQCAAVWKGHKGAKLEMLTQPPSAAVAALFAGAKALTAEDAKPVVAEALQEYEKIARAVKDADIPLLARRLAIGQRPFIALAVKTGAETVEELEARMRTKAQDLAVQKELLSQIESAKLKPGPAEVMLQATVSLPDAPEKDAPLETRRTVVVSVPILDSAAIFRKLKLNHPVRTPTLSDRGELVIYMFNQDGMWFWNPFLW